MHISFLVLLGLLIVDAIVFYLVGSNNPAKSAIQKAVDKLAGK